MSIPADRSSPRAKRLAQTRHLSWPRTLGIRPEAIELGGDRADLEVETVEALGAEHLVDGRIGASALSLRCRPDRSPAVGSTVRIGFEAEALHWFDAASGRRVDAGG